MMRNEGKKKKLLTFVFSLLLIGLYFVIFRFSADDAESSSNLSMRVSEHVVRLYHRLSCRPENGEIISAAAAAAEGVIRKLAHFTEYMALGFLGTLIWDMWVDRRSRCFLLVLAQLFLSAGADEVHQYFVPGRHASIWDVLIDVSGGIVGMMAVFCLKGIVEQWNHIRERESKICF